MKKVILTFFLCFSFLFSFGHETKGEKLELEEDFFNCWVKVVYLTTNPETLETTSFTWYQWLGYAGSQQSCDQMARDYANSN